MLSDLWYRHAVVYNIDLETFQDGNGDGCGDFEGLSRRLDYLVGLGVDTLWLGPFQPTPNRDNGYDVADYYGVDPRHGTSGDFVDFLHEARSRGLRVLIDLVVNHTSDRHPWFREASRSVDSRYHDWYVWAKKRPPKWKSGMVFPGVQEQTWTRAEEVRKWYFHRFHDFQPDLNMENPEVREEVRRIMGYWLALGVSGFRIDAVPFILEKPSPDGAAHPLRFEYLEEMRRFLQWRVGDGVLLGEANVLPQEARRYFDEHGLHLMFNFWVNQRVFLALATGDARPLAAALRETKKLPPTAQWATFLRNHDELDLGRLTEEERATVFERFAPDEGMRLFGRGIRRRLAPMLGERRRLELAYSLLLSLPGTPVLYYGDEIGMGDDLSRTGREAVRTPMQWSPGRHAGFTTAEKPFQPVISSGPYGHEHVNVDDQRRDPDSFLRWLTRMIRLRRECPEIGWGEWEQVSTRSPHVLALLYRWRGSAVLCVHNFDDGPREVTVRLDGDPAQLRDLTGDEDSRAGADGRHAISLDAHGYRWYGLGRADASPRRRVDDSR